MKKTLIKIIQFLFSNPGLFLKIKDIAFTNPAEHLYRTTKYIKSHHSYSEKSPYILDIGAADGRTSLYFSKQFASCKVVGFEPISEMHHKASLLCSVNPNIEIRKTALSDFNGETEINITANFLSSSLNNLNDQGINEEAYNQRENFKTIGKEKVQVARLDDITKNYGEILLMKMDTQGTELKILQGAVESLKKTRFILVEMNNNALYTGGCQYYEVDEFLRKNHFILVDNIVTYRPDGNMSEYDALYKKAIKPGNANNQG